MFASVRVRVEPASKFELIDRSFKSEELEQNLQLIDFPNCAIFGMLDVFLISGSSPIRNIRVVIEDVGYDPIDSSSMAFREAGRDAARKITEEIRKQVTQV